MRDVVFDHAPASDVALALRHDADVILQGSMTLEEIAAKFTYLAAELGPATRVWFNATHDHEVDLSLVPGHNLGCYPATPPQKI